MEKAARARRGSILGLQTDGLGFLLVDQLRNIHQNNPHDQTNLDGSLSKEEGCQDEANCHLYLHLLIFEADWKEKEVWLKRRNKDRQNSERQHILSDASSLPSQVPNSFRNSHTIHFRPLH